MTTAAHIVPARCPLTSTQLSVLRSLSQGYTPKQVAFDRACAEVTIRHVMRQIRDRLGAKTTAQAVLVAARKGLI